MSGTTTGGGNRHNLFVNRSDGTFANANLSDDDLRAMAAAIQDSNPDLYAQIMANLPSD